MSAGQNLERRYRRVLRLLPGYYRAQWEEDMVAAFLDSWLTGDQEVDARVLRFCRPGWPEITSVAGLAGRLYLGGAGTPRRYFAWGQAVRRVVLAVALAHAVQNVGVLVILAWSQHLVSWLPAFPASMTGHQPGQPWPLLWYAVTCAWIVIFVVLVLGYYRTARLLATATVGVNLVVLLQGQFTGHLLVPYLSWAAWVLLGLVPALGMAAFHSGAPPLAARPWLLALPLGYLLVGLPVLAIEATGNAAWLPDPPGVCCILVALACLAHLPRVVTRRNDGSGVWSLTLLLLAVVAGIYRIVSLGDFLHDPHLLNVSLAELLIMTVAAALVASDAAHTQAATPAPPAQPSLG